MTKLGSQVHNRTYTLFQIKYELYINVYNLWLAHYTAGKLMRELIELNTFKTRKNNNIIDKIKVSRVTKFNGLFFSEKK